MADLRGKTAVLSGATNALGEDLALNLAQKGVNICLLTHNLDRAQTLLEQVKQLGADGQVYPCRIDREEEVITTFERVFAQFGSLDIAFNNAGIMPSAPIYPKKALVDTSEKDWDSYLQNALKGIFFSMKHQARYMYQQSSGGIIMNTAFYGIEPKVNQSLYYLSRLGIQALGQTLMLEAQANQVPLTVKLLVAQEESFSREQLVTDIINLLSQQS